MVKSANTNGLLDNDCDSSKYQTLERSVKLTLILNFLNPGEDKEIGKIFEHEYYESFYRNYSDNIKLSNFKDRSMIESAFAAFEDKLFLYGVNDCVDC